VSAVPDTFQLGLDTFGDVTVDAHGALQSAAHSLRDVVSEAVLAEQVGVDAFAVGEHHRPDFAISAPEVMLAAIAARTERMLLGSAVTVLSTDDPVRVFQRFSTLDAMSRSMLDWERVPAEEPDESYPLTVHQAAGIVMVQLDTTIEEALVRLRAAAYRAGRPVSELAADVVSGRYTIGEEQP